MYHLLFTRAPSMLLNMKVALFIGLVSIVTGHSLLGEPKPMSPKICRVGGATIVENCPGPCDTKALFSKSGITPPGSTETIWRRGETVTIRYQRNNHGPGGFVRLSLVPIARMMSKGVHARNAFHYSCWGGDPVEATDEEQVRDSKGFSITGSDGEYHDEAPGYYTTKVEVPVVVPDGVYVLGWAWFGGIGGSFEGNTPDHPFPNRYFGDYWSCAFVKVSGGARMRGQYRPEFQSNLSKYWGDACWSGADRPGLCEGEPCTPTAQFMRPREFQNGKVPRVLQPWMFRHASSCSEKGRRKGAPCSPGPVPTTPPGPLSM